MASYNLGTASGRIVVDGSGAEEGFSAAEAAAQSFQDTVKSQIETIDKFANRMLIAGASGAGAMGVLTATAAGFEKQLSGVEAVSGATEEQMDRVAEAALRIGAATKYSATEAAAAIEELTKAGISIEDSLGGAADATVALAAAGEISLPRAAEIAANAMNNFRLSADRMPRVADLIAGAANASAISVEELGSSLSQVGAVAALAGLSFDDTAVAIAQMGNAGIKGSDAGTSLKTMFMNLIPTTNIQIDKFRELGLYTIDVDSAMRKLADMGIDNVDRSLEGVLHAVEGYNEEMGGARRGTDEARAAAMKTAHTMGLMSNAFFNAEGNTKSLAEIQQILADTTSGMTREQKLMNLEVLFGADAIRAAAVLSQNGAEGFNAMAEAMGKVGAADVAETRLDNLSGSLEELSGSWETLSITIGTYFLRPAKAAVDALTGLVNVLNGMPGFVKGVFAALLFGGTSLAFLTGSLIKLIPVVAAFIAQSLGLKAASQAWKVLTVAVATFRTTGNVAGAMAAASAQAAIMGGWMAKIAGRAKGMAVAVGWLIRAGAAIAAFATGPVGIAIAIIAGLVLIGKILYERWEPFRVLVDRIGASIRDFFVPIIQRAKQGLNELVAAFTTGESSGSGFLGFMSKVGAVARFVWDAIVRLGQAFMDNVWPAIQNLGREVGGAFLNAWNKLVAVWTSTLQPALQELWDVIVTQLWPALKELWVALWPIIRVVGLVAAVIVGVLLVALYHIVMFILTKVLPVLIRFVSWIMTNLIGAFAAVAVWVVTYLISPFIRLISFILARVIPIWSFLASIMTTNLRMVATVVGAVVDAVLGWFNRLTGGADEGANQTGNAFTRIVDWIRNAWNNIVTVTSQIFNTLTAPFRAVAAVVGPIVSAVFGFIGTVIMGFVRIAISILTFFWTVVKTLFEIGVLLIRIALMGLSIVWRAIWNAIVAVATWVWDFIWGYIQARINGIRAVIHGVLSVIKTVWDAIWGAIMAVVDAIWSRIGGRVTSGINAVKSVIDTATGFIRRVWDTMWKNLSTAVDNARSALQGKVDSVVNTVKGPFDNAINWLKTAGRNIIDGLVNGITERIGAATAAVTRVGDSIKKTLGGVLELGSPSRWAMRVGKWTVQGIEIGLSRELANLQATVERVGTITANGIVPPTLPRTGPTVRVETPAPSVVLNQSVNAPQNMDPDQVATMAARRAGYALAGSVNRIVSPVSGEAA